MLIAGNWKMHKGPSMAAEFCAALHVPSGVDVVVCPPYASLREAVASGLTVYAQNVHWAAEGPFTGEVSAEMLRELGVRGSIVGHSERRQYFGETDTGVARRTHAALSAGLRVIACVGGTHEERDAGDTETILRVQVEAIRDACGEHDALVLAYEPVWAIGTGHTATPELAQRAHAFVKSLLDGPVLYGGSVKPENAAELLAEPDVDGALVGGASLDIDSFASICETAARLRS
jgi:triosephosphate isomerase (TIM)